MPLKALFIGSLNTDILALGLEKFPDKNEHVYGDELLIAPGGKARNACHMTALFLDVGAVGMMGVTVKDKYGLYESPLQALQSVGVNTDSVVIEDPTDKFSLPGIAIVAVEKSGDNRIIVFPGISHTLSPKHVDLAEEKISSLQTNDGYLCLGLEALLDTIEYAAKIAQDKKIKVILDPGGVKTGVDYSSLLKKEFFCIKPNEHEARILTGVNVVDSDTAIGAGRKLLEYGVKNVVITLGEKGAVLVTDEYTKVFSIPRVFIDTSDSTGCGDQFLAGLIYGLVQGKKLNDAVQIGVNAGTIQYGKKGVVPITKQELLESSKE